MVPESLSSGEAEMGKQVSLFVLHYCKQHFTNIFSENMFHKLF